MVEKVILTTMCALVKEGKVLVINRSKNWVGYAFPGGHVDPSESITECVKREMKEETGLNIRSLRFQGMVNFYRSKYNERYIVFNYRSDDFDGTLKQECDEGTLSWVDIKDLDRLELARGMELRLDMFFENDVKELYLEVENAEYTRIIKEQI